MMDRANAHRQPITGGRFLQWGNLQETTLPGAVPEALVPTEKTQALVIRLVDFSETSRVVTFYTREFGKLGAMAKGGRRLRGPFAGALDLLSVCRIVLIRKYSDSLDLLTEAELVKGFAPQRNNLQVLYAGYYVAELLQELTHDDDPHTHLFDIALETLRALESGGDARLIVHRFELAILRETGHMPHLDGCVLCGSSYSDEQSAWFSVAAGGLVCTQCARRGGVTLRLSAGSANVLRLLGDDASDQWKRLQLAGGVEREVAAVTRGAIMHLTGKRLRTAQFLGESPT
jgi:DNA repair protein RecO (recombination protein O)